MRHTGRLGRWTWLILCLGLLLLWPLGCGQKQRERPSMKGVPIVRVRVLELQQRVTLESSQPPLLTVASNPQPQRLNLPDDPVVIELTPTGWRIGGSSVGSGELTLECEEEGALSLNGLSHRGKYRLVPVEPGRFDVVNHVDIDSYLKSVVPKEMLWNWSVEAYRAQAIIARTYALYECARISESRHFHINNDVRSQVYGGIKAESDKSTVAVDDTLGVVVAWGDSGQERIFKAYFSSCCGGVRQSGADGFNEPHAALSDQNVGSLCNASPRFNWPPVVVRKDELTRRFRLWGEKKARPEKSMALVDRIDVQATNPYGRPVRFVVTDVKGNRYSLIGEEIRWAVNTGAAPGTGINSSFFKPVNEDATVSFSDGHGWGHGVGMCQWCAETQSSQGMRHEDIVLSAFPGAKLLRAY